MSDWIRVTRGEPCPICQHPDWCLITKDKSAVICPRVESPKRCGESGWLHRLTDTPREHTVTKREFERKAALKDMSGLASLYQGSVEQWRLHHHAAQLGVGAAGLISLGIGWSKVHGAWSFPMCDGNGKVIGIRLRREDGQKFAVRGSKNALFIPAGAHRWQGHGLAIVEGPTDTAAMVHLGITHAIGRPFNRGGVGMIQDFCKNHNVSDVLIVADSDGPGMVGAMELHEALNIPTRYSVIVRPPRGLKDMRKYVQAGGNGNEFWRHVRAETEA